MKTQKIKRYRLSVSRVFPKTHPREGENTGFISKIESTIDCNDTCFGECNICHLRDFKDYKKLHTIRANYPLWGKRMKEVQEGKAIIELCYWSDKPYRSKQIVFATLDKDSGCGMQMIEFCKDRDNIPCIKYPIISHHAEPEITNIAKNDGLSLEDFKAWFKGYDLSKPLAIIQFTGFRY